jgi:hypothetical protein
MSKVERCPNAVKKGLVNGKPVYKCAVLCPICKGSSKVITCPGCDGAGLRVGGFPCATCGTCGKVSVFS